MRNFIGILLVATALAAKFEVNEEAAVEESQEIRDGSFKILMAESPVEAGDRDSKKFTAQVMGYIDDPEDADALEDSYEGNSLERNHITGKDVHGVWNGMTDTGHFDNTRAVNNGIESDTPHVKSPGYVAEDAHLSKTTGHYYLGTGRRRIGAGYGRRRAPYRKEVRIQDLSPKEKARIDRLSVWADQPLSEDDKDKLLKEYDVKRSENDDEAPPKPLTPAEKKDLLDFLLHRKQGPIFFKQDNYKGAHWTPQRSREHIYPAPDSSISGDPPNISSMRVPRGWCAKLFDKEKWKGNHVKLCSQDVWWLGKFPLMKGCSQAGLGCTRSNWDNTVRSFLLSKFEYVAHPPNPLWTCPCGSTLRGKVTCTRKGGGFDKGTVSNELCRKAGVLERRTPTKKCPKCEPCTETDATAAQPTACLCGKVRCRAGQYCETAAHRTKHRKAAKDKGDKCLDKELIWVRLKDAHKYIKRTKEMCSAHMLDQALITALAA